MLELFWYFGESLQLSSGDWIWLDWKVFEQFSWFRTGAVGWLADDQFKGGMGSKVLVIICASCAIFSSFEQTLAVRAVVDSASDFWESDFLELTPDFEDQLVDREDLMVRISTTTKNSLHEDLIFSLDFFRFYLKIVKQTALMIFFI